MENQENKNPENQNNGTYFQSAGAFIWDLVKILVIALVIIVPFRMFVAEPFVVSGSSMLPNFHDRDYLIVDRLSYLISSPKRGQVIVLLYPKDTSQYFIKRIIGLPGETICFSAIGQVIVSPNKISSSQCAQGQGPVLNEPYLPAHLPTFGTSDPITLGSGEYFVLGDNRTASSDSRVWGILPKADIVGKIFVKVYPFSDAGLFQTPTY